MNSSEKPIPEAWLNQSVRIVLPVSASTGVLSVGNRTGTLVEVNDRGVVLADREGQNKLVNKFVPWSSIYQIVQEVRE